jgi:hypothetical protein
MMLALIVSLMVSLVAACARTTEPVGTQPVNEPETESTSESTPYPPVGATVPAGETPGGATAYPDINQPGDMPVNSNTPGAEGPYPDPLYPLPGEENMERGEVFIEESGIITLESFPPQYRLHLVGNLPTPCHHLRANVSEPDDQNRIQVEVYSLYDPNEICTQVLAPFENDITLGSYPTGKYSVLVNGEQVAEIDAP